MTLRVNPIAYVRVPAEKVWDLLVEPANYCRWLEAHLHSVDPPGRVQAGQTLRAQVSTLGIPWELRMIVEDVEESHRGLHVMTLLPLGISIFDHITCVPLDDSSCQVSLACEFTFSPVWWGHVLERYATRQLYTAVADALSRMKLSVEMSS